MKLDFYDLFSMHTPQDLPNEGNGNYFTAAVKGRVMENIPANTRKPVRIKNIGKAFFAAAAAVVVLVTGTLAASALGLIDLERIFGGIFKSGTEHLAGITTVPQNVTTTGDDRLSMRVLGIGGTETEAFGVIEIKRNDGGVFPEHIGKVGFGHLYAADSEFLVSESLELIDETTAIIYFREKALAADENDSLIGTTFTYNISQIFDTTEFEKLHEKYGVYIDDKEDAAYLEYLRENKDVILDGDWTISFPLDYDIEKRSVSVNEPFRNVDYGIWSSVITEIEYSAITLDITLDDVVNYGRAAYIPYVSVKLDSGEEFSVSWSYGTCFENEENKKMIHYSFDKPIDIDSVESITIGDTVIPVK